LELGFWHDPCFRDKQNFKEGKKMKKILAVVGILALAAVIAVPVLAQGPGYGKGRYMQGFRGDDQGSSPRYGWGYKDLTDEQRAQMDALQQKFFDETAQVRSQLLAKKGELNVLMNTSNPDLEKAKALQKEVSDLKAKMAQERINLYAETKKIDPDAQFGRGWGRGKGFGPNGGDRGPGMGRGLHRGGPGQGPCWN
jgi:zinc resistance-associated protein